MDTKTKGTGDRAIAERQRAAQPLEGSAAHGTHGEGVVTNGDQGLDNASLLETAEQTAENGFAPQVEEHLVALFAEILQARTEARRRNESLHRYLFSRGRPWP